MVEGSVSGLHAKSERDRAQVEIESLRAELKNEKLRADANLKAWYTCFQMSEAAERVFEAAREMLEERRNYWGIEDGESFGKHREEQKLSDALDAAMKGEE